jgi:hypothetical protein
LKTVKKIKYHLFPGCLRLKKNPKKWLKNRPVRPAVKSFLKPLFPGDPKIQTDAEILEKPGRASV